MYFNVMPACQQLLFTSYARQVWDQFYWYLIRKLFLKNNFFRIYQNLLICNISESIANNSKIVTTLHSMSNDDDCSLVQAVIIAGIQPQQFALGRTWRITIFIGFHITFFLLSVHRSGTKSSLFYYSLFRWG